MPSSGLITPWGCKSFYTEFYFHVFICTSGKKKFALKTFTYISSSPRIQLDQRNLEKFCTLTQHNLTVISPDQVLSKLNRDNCLKLFNSYKEIKFFSSKNFKKAAVLVPLSQIGSKLAFLYTQRAFHLKVNGGETAFPGGMFDEPDGTLEKTALREAYEEVGLLPEKVDLWGKGPEIHRPDVKVTPVLGYIGQLSMHQLKLNTSEVVSVFPVTLENLCSSKTFRVTRFRSGKSSVFVTPVYLGGEKRIWGLTAYITHIVLSSLIPDIYGKNINFLPKIQKMVHYKGKFNSTEKNT